jgi:hypothetical protein
MQALKLHQEMFERRRRSIIRTKGRDLRRMLNDANKPRSDITRIKQHHSTGENTKDDKQH